MKRLSNVLILIGCVMILYSLISFIPQLTIGSYGEEAVKKALATPSSPSKILNQPIVHKPLYDKRPQKGEKIGDLIIPKLNTVLPIIEGTDPDELAKGVGHYSQSVLPGESDNSVLSGHRDTVFRQIGKLKIGDKLITKTKAGTFTYEITKIWIVDEDDRTVIVSHKGQKILTLTTCYPFNWIGPAPQRYIIQSKLVDEK